MERAEPPGCARPRIWFWLAAFLLFFSVTSESLWIDEARTHRFSSISGLGTLVQEVTRTPNSEAQMPGYLFLAWGADKLLGSSEWAMRAQNYLWGALALFFFWRASCRRQAPWMVLFFSLHPFLWFYMDEARPYAMQIALGAWMLDLLLRLEGRPVFGAKLAGEWGLVLLLLCGSSLLGVIPAALAGAVVLAVCILKQIRPGRGAWAVLGVCLALLLVLGCYYGWTLKQGAGGITQETPSWGWSNLAFVIYEFGGYGALGPGRTDLREMVQQGWWPLLRGSVPWFPGFILLSAGWILSGAGREMRAWLVGKARQNAVVGIWVVGGMLGIFVASRLAGFSFWGRHFSPLFAPALFLAFMGLRAAGAEWERSRTALVGLVFLGSALAWGALEIRFSSRHQKEDYRTATAVARQYLREGRTVLWAADIPTAGYYGLEAADWPGKLGILTRPDFREMPAIRPDFIFLSKPKDFDRNRVIKNYVRHEGFRLEDRGINYFQIWSRSPENER